MRPPISLEDREPVDVHPETGLPTQYQWMTLDPDMRCVSAGEGYRLGQYVHEQYAVEGGAAPARTFNVNNSAMIVAGADGKWYFTVGASSVVMGSAGFRRDVRYYVPFSNGDAPMDDTERLRLRWLQAGVQEGARVKVLAEGPAQGRIGVIQALDVQRGKMTVLLATAEQEFALNDVRLDTWGREHVANDAERVLSGKLPDTGE